MRNVWLALIVGAVATVSLAAQGRWRGDGLPQNQPYSDRFVFTRIQYESAGGWGFGGGTWAHDYPRGDRHLTRILADLTAVHLNVEGTNVLRLDDPELFRYPVAYLSEPGFWHMNDEEAEGLRNYLRKGGFMIFDDFEAGQWTAFESNMRRTLPELQPLEIGIDHPIFHAFFELQAIHLPHPLVAVEPIYYGYFENNDRAGRMLAIVNYNNDIAEYWEWSDTGFFPVEFSNDAYKLGVNYIVYSMTH